MPLKKTPLICFSVLLGQICFGYALVLLQSRFYTDNLHGYPASVIPVTLGRPSFLAYVGLVDRLDRKNSVYVNAVIGLFSGTLIIGAQNIPIFLAGWFFAGWSSFSFLVLTLVYTTELSPPKFCGFFVGLNTVFFYRYWILVGCLDWYRVLV
jgi:hypothetical protein